jgi:DNA-damage-inducible protein D
MEEGMIHYEFRKLWDAVPGQPAPDVAETWQRLQAHVRAENSATAALLATQAGLELDVEKQQATLVLHPGLYHMITRQPDRRALIDRAVEAVLGYGWTWTSVAGAWRSTPKAPARASEPRAEDSSAFEQLKRVDADGEEFWAGRELATVMGYANYRQFELVAERAKMACVNSGHDVTAHFVAQREATGRNVYLSRYACYLIIQNMDPKKPAVAQGQTYFAVQTRRQEVADAAVAMEDQRRVMLRQEVAVHNKKLAAAARRAGVQDGEDFRNFQNHGYKGLYGGLSARMIRDVRSLEDGENILDYMGSTELAANLFRATQTEEKMRRDIVHEKEEAMRLHYRVGAKVRQTMAEISGVMPEDLPVVEHINEVRKRLKQMRAGEERKAL